MKSKKGAMSVEAIVILLLVLVTAALILAGLAYRFQWFGKGTADIEKRTLTNICGALGRNGVCLNDCSTAQLRKSPDAPINGYIDCDKECCIQ